MIKQNKKTWMIARGGDEEMGVGRKPSICSFFVFKKHATSNLHFFHSILFRRYTDHHVWAEVHNIVTSSNQSARNDSDAISLV